MSSRVPHVEDEEWENAEVIDDPELEAELDAAIADADANPDDSVDAWEFLRELRQRHQSR